MISMQQKSNCLWSHTIRFLIVATIFFSTLSAQTQEVKKEEKKPGNQTQLSLEGMVAVSVGDRLVAFNVGGPAFMVKCSPDFKFGVGGFPSFFFRNGKAGARLGVGPRVDYKNLVFFSSFYHFDRSDIWVGSVGLGYKFHGKK